MGSLRGCAADRTRRRRRPGSEASPLPVPSTANPRPVQASRRGVRGWCSGGRPTSPGAVPAGVGQPECDRCTGPGAGARPCPGGGIAQLWPVSSGVPGGATGVFRGVPPSTAYEKRKAIGGGAKRQRHRCVGRNAPCCRARHRYGAFPVGNAGAVTRRDGGSRACDDPARGGGDRPGGRSAGTRLCGLRCPLPARCRQHRRVDRPLTARRPPRRRGRAPRRTPEPPSRRRAPGPR